MMDFIDTFKPFLLLMVAVVGFGLAWPYIKHVFKEEKGESKEKKGRVYSYRRQKFFMSKAEHVFYKTLESAVGGEYFIFAQVHLPTILDHKIKGQNWKGARAHINRKSVDFVLCDKNYISPQLAIELDDPSHEREDRKKRDREVDRMLNEAGLPLLRLPSGNYNADELRQKINQTIK